MRKFNTILTVLIIILFLDHAVFGSLQLFGANNAMVMKRLARACSALIIVHAVIGVKLTFDAVRVWRRTGAPYFRENSLFWARRLSGVVIMVLIFFHMFAFGKTTGGVYQLKPYTTEKMILQLLLVLSVALHVLTNVRPLLIALGAGSLRRYLPDILVVLAVVLLVSAAAFIVYYFRWQAL